MSSQWSGTPEEPSRGPVYGDVPRYGYQPPGPAATSPQGPLPSADEGGTATYPLPYGPPAYPPPGQPPYPPPVAPPYDGPNAPQPTPGQLPLPYPPQQAPAYPYTRWRRRVGAYLIDFAPNLVAQIPFYVGYVSWLADFSAQAATGATTLPSTGLIWMLVGFVLLLLAFGWQVYNRWLVGGRTGQSLGKRLLGIELVAELTGQPIGPMNAFLRDLLHILDGMAYVGYLWPLWDAKRQTFADKLMNTVVIDSVVINSVAAADRRTTA